MQLINRMLRMHMVLRWDNDEQRKTSLLVAALGNEEGVNRKDSWAGNLQAITSLVDGWLDND